MVPGVGGVNQEGGRGEKRVIHKCSRKGQGKGVMHLW